MAHLVLVRSRCLRLSDAMRVKHDSLVLFVLACVACSNTDSGELSMPALGGFSGAAGAAGAAGVAPGGMVMPPGQDAGMAGGFGGMGAVGGAAGASGAGWVEPPRDGGDMMDTDAESPDAGARRGALTILNYNVHGLPPLITGDDTPARMSMISPLLNAFDVVGLQEDFEPANHMLLTMDSMHAYLEHYDDPLPNRLYGAGLTILSNPDVVDVHAQHYIACFGELLGPGLTDCVASKGFHVTRLKLAQGVEIDFYNTHMDAGGG